MTIKLNVLTRDGTGTSFAKNLRRNGEVPAVIYGVHKKNINIKINSNDLYIAMKQKNFSSSVLNLVVDGKKNIAVIVKNCTKHFVKKQVMHLDFYEASTTSELTVSVPLSFINQDKNDVLKSGGSLDINISEIEVSCLAKNLPSVIEVDVSKFAANYIIHQSDLILPKGVSVKSNIDEEHNLPIASIHAKAQAETASESTE